MTSGFQFQSNHINDVNRVKLKSATVFCWVLILFLFSGCASSYDSMYEAAKSGDTEMVGKLLSRGISGDEQYNGLYTPIILAAFIAEAIDAIRCEVRLVLSDAFGSNPRSSKYFMASG